MKNSKSLIFTCSNFVLTHVNLCVTFIYFLLKRITRLVMLSIFVSRNWWSNGNNGNVAFIYLISRHLIIKLRGIINLSSFIKARGIY